MVIYLYNDLNAIYPKGAVYITTNTSVPSWFPGTWTEVEAGRFLKAVGSSGTTGNSNAGNTGGTSIEQKHFPQGVTGYINMHNAAVATPIHNVSGVFSSAQTNNSYAAPGTAVGGAQSVGVIKFDLGGQGQAHTHAAGDPKGYGVHVFVRTA